MRTQILLLLLALFLAVLRSSAVTDDDWVEIDNLFHPHLQAMARFAVSEHNKMSGDSRAYKLLHRAKVETVDDVNYLLHIATEWQQQPPPPPTKCLRLPLLPMCFDAPTVEPECFDALILEIDFEKKQWELMSFDNVPCNPRI